MEIKVADCPLPSGTVMKFCQAIAPVGWTQIPIPKAAKTVSGTVGGSVPCILARKD